MRIYREGNMVFVENLNTSSANNLEQYPLCSLRTALFGDSGFNIINVHNNRLVRTISDYNVSDNTQNIQDKTGAVQGNLDTALLYLSGILCFDTVVGGIEARVTDLENQLITITYYDLIDISTTQTGTITKPTTSANLIIGAFGLDGNAIESTLTTSNKPTFIEAVDSSGNDVIISLQSDWTYSSNVLFPDPLALIYQFTIPTKEQGEIDIDRRIDYYKEPEKDGKVVITLEAGENITTHHAVMIVNDLAYNYDTSNVLNINRYAGVSLQSVTTGNNIQVQTDGILFTPYVFSEGDNIYSNNTGLLTNIESNPISHVIGKAITTTKVLLKRFNPIIKI